MNLKDKCSTWLKSPALRQYRTILCVWTTTAVVYAVVKLLMGKYNNYKIFKGVFWHAIEGLPLYECYHDQYYDCNHYGILFSLIIAPFAVLPDWLGVVLWVAANTALLFYAIKQLPLSHNQKVLVYWFSYVELMTAQGVQQFNISVVAIILLSYAFISKKRDFWAACVIALGALVKIYPIVALAFFFFSKQKVKLTFSMLFWLLVWFLVPVLYTPGLDYVVSQYVAWFNELAIKAGENMFASAQNVSLLGVVRKISGNPNYSDLWLIIPGLVLFCIPYLRFSQYRNLRFRLMLLANVLLFVVLFSTGSEACGYIIAMVGVAIWYVCSPSKHVRYNYWLLITTLIIVSISTTELVPSFIRSGFIRPYVFKAWPCIVVWFTICYEMIFLEFDSRKLCERVNITESM